MGLKWKDEGVSLVVSNFSMCCANGSSKQKVLEFEEREEKMEMLLQYLGIHFNQIEEDHIFSLHFDSFM